MFLGAKVSQQVSSWLHSKFVIRTAGPLVILFLWAALTKAFPATRYAIADPIECLCALVHEFCSMDFWQAFLSSTLKVGIAFTIGAIVGIPAGFFFGRSKCFAMAFQLPVDFARSIPVSALFPAFVLLLGLGSGAQVAAASFGSMMILLINTAQGVRNCRPQRDAYLRTLGASEFQITRYSVFWESLPSIFTGCRLALSSALVLIVVTEMLSGGEGGLGQRIQDFRVAYRVPEMWSTIIIVGTLGLSINLLPDVIESRYLHWHGK